MRDTIDNVIPSHGRRSAHFPNDPVAGSRLPVADASPQPPIPITSTIRHFSIRKSTTWKPGSGLIQRGIRIHANVNDIRKIVCYHEEFSLSKIGEKVKDMPKMADLTAYNITDAQEKTLWDNEIQRLVDVVNDREKPITYAEAPPHGTSSELGGDTKESYEILTSLSDRMRHCLNVIDVDDEAIIREHCPKLHQVDVFQRAFNSLHRLIDEDSQQASIQRGSTVDFFNLVNYITALLARLFCDAAYGTEWQNSNLALLATWAAKLKAVSTNLVSFADRSVSSEAANSVPAMRVGAERAADGLGNKGASFANRDAPSHSDRLFFGIGSQDDTNAFTSTEGVVKEFYWMHYARYRSHIRDPLVYLLGSLRGKNQLTPIMPMPITSFELCAEVFDSGLPGLDSTLIFQDRDGDYLGSSNTKCIAVAHAAFDLLQQALSNIQSQQNSRKRPPSRPRSQPTNRAPHYGNGILKSTTTPDISSNLRPDQLSEAPGAGSNADQSSLPIGTKITWTYEEKPQQTLYLETMEEIISAMVPLYLSSPIIVDKMSDWVNLAILTTGRINPAASTNRYQHQPFTASFCMTTSEYKSPEKTDTSICSLSKALLTEEKLRTGKRPADFRDPLESTPRSYEQHQRMKDNREQIETSWKKMKEWEVDQMGVMVQCGLYVWTVIAICTFLVLGGIAIGLTVKDRVPAVDPFNITTYCWVLAAFIILVAKAIRVDNWSWRDFLRRRVFCKSVSELHAVSGVDVQLIMAKLLSEERSNHLRTRGPYNSVFKRRSDAEGFSIDHPLSMWTMLACGLVMIVVATPRGEALVCLDLRKGVDIDMVNSANGGSNEEQYLCCEQLYLDDSLGRREQEGESHPRKVPLTRAKLEWYKVLGMYNARTSLFV